MQVKRGANEAQKAAVLLIQVWRNPANQDIRTHFAGDILLFDAFLRAAAAGHVRVHARGHDPLQKKLDPIIASMREINF